MSALKKDMMVVHTYDSVLIQENPKKKSKMMLSVIVNTEKTIMKRQNNDECLVEGCDCKKFETFQINLLKKKKTVTDIKFLTEDQIKDDVLAWNCFSVNIYNKKQESDVE